MICVLNSELSKDTMVKNDIVESNRLPVNVENRNIVQETMIIIIRMAKVMKKIVLTYVKRTENNNFFYPGDQFCSNQNTHT